MLASLVNLNISPCFGLKSCYKNRVVSVKCIGTAPAPDSSSVVVESVKVNKVFSNKKIESLNGVEKKEVIGFDVIRLKEEKLEALWDDGYGTQSVKDYLDLAKDIIKPDGGPPRWFCPVVADHNDTPLPNSPVLLFLPGKF